MVAKVKEDSRYFFSDDAYLLIADDDDEVHDVQACLQEISFEDGFEIVEKWGIGSLERCGVAKTKRTVTFSAKTAEWQVSLLGQILGTWTEDVAAITSALYVGSGGILDATSSGVYTGTGNAHYVAKIVTKGTAPTADTVKFSTDGGATYAEAVDVTGAAQTIAAAVAITFVATSGHTVDDEWHIFATDSNVASLNDTSTPQFFEILCRLQTQSGKDLWVVLTDAVIDKTSLPIKKGAFVELEFSGTATSLDWKNERTA